MTDNPTIEHSVTHAHNLLDKLAALVGQDRATTAVKWVDEVKQHLADAIQSAGERIAEVTDPAVLAEIEQLEQALLNRDAEIATMKAAIVAPSALTEVVEGDPVVEPPPAVEPVEEF